MRYTLHNNNWMSRGDLYKFLKMNNVKGRSKIKKNKRAMIEAFIKI